MEFKFEDRPNELLTDANPESGHQIGDFIHEMNKDGGKLDVWGNALHEVRARQTFNKAGQTTRKDKEAESRRLLASKPKNISSVEEVAKNIESFIDEWIVKNNMTDARAFDFWGSLSGNVQMQGRPLLWKALDSAITTRFEDVLLGKS